MPYFTTPEEPLDYIHDLLQGNRGDLGLKYVAYGDEDKIPRFPAVKVTAGLFTKELHATRGWLNTFRVDLLVYHGNLKVTHAQRSKDDLLTVTAVRNLLHSHMTLGGGIVQGWVISESSALIARPKAAAVVGTRMIWEGIAREQFIM